MTRWPGPQSSFESDPNHFLVTEPRMTVCDPVLLCLRMQNLCAGRAACPRRLIAFFFLVFPCSVRKEASDRKEAPVVFLALYPAPSAHTRPFQLPSNDE